MNFNEVQLLNSDNNMNNDGQTLGPPVHLRWSSL